MNHINVLYISFCLLLHVPILYPSEGKEQTNPLINPKTYQDGFGKFTLEKVEKIAKNEGSSSFWFMLHLPENNFPLKWTCSPENKFGQKERIKIAKFCLEKGIFSRSINIALNACLKNNNGDRNAGIIKILKDCKSPDKNTAQDSPSN